MVVERRMAEEWRKKNTRKEERKNEVWCIYNTAPTLRLKYPNYP